MSERNKGSHRVGALLLAVSGLFSGAALAAGNIQFGRGVPAVAEPLTAETAGTRTANGTNGESVVEFPGFGRVIMAPVTPEESEQAIRSRPLPAGLSQGAASMAVSRVVGDTSPTGPASIAELARALKNDVDLIYEYVHDNIGFYP
ncbi:MAG TPA: hypothetical protein PLO08_13770, partial [Alicycliphilus sp.]|nr:hypothetical protein [Alicycliphilus sp.]